jgi:hypothetical protein
MAEVAVCAMCGGELLPCPVHPHAMAIAKSDYPLATAYESRANFIDVSLMAPARLRRIVEIMSHLPHDERRELADLIFAEIDEDTQVAMKLAIKRRPVGR